MEDTPGGVQPCPPGEKGTPLVVPVLLKTIEAISHLRIYLPKDMRSESSRVTVWKSVIEVQTRFPEGVPLLDPVENMRIEDDKFKALVGVGSSIIWCDLDPELAAENCYARIQDVLPPAAQGPAIT